MPWLLGLMTWSLLLALRKPSSGNPATFTRALRCEPILRRLVVLFCLLGAGYMLIEIALFQKLRATTPPLRDVDVRAAIRRGRDDEFDE